MIDWKKLVEDREKKRKRSIRGSEGDLKTGGVPKEHKWDNGILDHLFDGLEDEAEEAERRFELE